MKNKIFKVFGFTLLVLSTILFLYINIAHPWEEDDFAMYGAVTLFLSIGFFYLAYRNKNQDVMPTQNSIDDTNHINNDSISHKNTVNSIPLTCPQCKSPNTKRLRLCEWCGNEIV